MKHIRINAVISKKKWDENDQEYFEEIDWSVELENENQEDFDKLIALNSKQDFQYYELPSYVQHHLMYNSSFEFNELDDQIKKINTHTIRNL